MHEVSLGEAILDAVERRAAGRKVRRVKVRVGTLHRVVGPALDQGWELVTEGSVAAGAPIEMVTIPVTVTCRSCGEHHHSDDMAFQCESCGSVEVDVEGGEELILESLELEDE
jgi:hydrogenase nickel incorporation protein HypA/HybF